MTAARVRQAVQLFVDHALPHVVKKSYEIDGRSWRDVGHELDLDMDDDRTALRLLDKMHHAVRRGGLPGVRQRANTAREAGRVRVVRELANQAAHMRMDDIMADAYLRVIRQQWTDIAPGAGKHLDPLLIETEPPLRPSLEQSSDPESLRTLVREEIDRLASSVAATAHSQEELRDAVQLLADRTESTDGDEDLARSVADDLAAALELLQESSGAGDERVLEALERLDERLSQLEEGMPEPGQRTDGGAQFGALEDRLDQLQRTFEAVAKGATAAPRAGTSPTVEVAGDRRTPTADLLHRLRALGLPTTGLHLTAAFALAEEDLPLQRNMLDVLHRVARELAAADPQAQHDGDLVDQLRSWLHSVGMSDATGG